MKNDDYFNNVNPDLLRLIPPDARVVLEVGCGAGALAAAYRRVNPAVKWIGVEADLIAWHRAEQRMHRCFLGAVESLEGGLKDMIEPPDVIICGDVLEHLIDPWRVLGWLAELAAPGCQVLASVPNVGHWSVIRDLLAGRFEYQDEGLLDRTHLRWFTLDSIRKLFQGCGLIVHEVRGRDIANDGYDSWANLLTFEPLKEVRAYQFVVRSVKPPADIAPLWIHAITSCTVCVPVRIDQPLAALATVPGVRCFSSDSGGPELVFPEDVDVVLILQRICEEPARYATAVERLLDKYPRLIVVYEIDDGPEDVPAMPASDYLFLRLCHAVQSSTEPIAEFVRGFNPNVAVFPNQVAELPELPEKDYNIDPVIFFGAINRASDWAPIMPALNRVIADHPELRFTVVHDRAFYDSLQTDRKGFVPTCPYPSYLGHLQASSIALLPLEPTRFNQCKSDLKFLECAANGVCVIAGETVYRETIDLRDNIGTWYRNPDGFELILRMLLNDPAMRQRHAREAYAYVRDHRMLGQHYRRRLDWYRQLIQSREALAEQLRFRCPGLRQSVPAQP